MQVIMHYYTSEIYKPMVIGHRARARQEMHTEFRAGRLSSISAWKIKEK